MKILFILPEYYPHSGGGISTYYVHYIKALQSFCSKIKVIVGSGYVQSDDAFNYDGVAVEYLKPSIYQDYLRQFTKYDLFPEFRNNIAAAWAMWQQAQCDTDFDIIECTDFGLGFIPWTIEHHRPLVTRLHGSSGQIALHETANQHALSTHLFQSAELGLLPVSDILISHSKSNMQFWNALFRQTMVKHIYPVFQTRVIPTLSAERENYGLVTARIQRWKGPVELCRAAEILPESCIIKWVGRDMPFEGNTSTLKYLATTFPLVYNKNVLFQLPLPQNDVHKLQREAKFGIIPSTWDMFNFTMLEFMVAGTPVICSDSAGASELIEHGKNGFKYEANDVSSLSNCIELINQLNESAYLQIAYAGIETVNSVLNTKNLIQANVDLYHSAIASFKLAASNQYFDEIYRPSEKQHGIETILDKQTFHSFNQYLLKRFKSSLFK